MKREARGSVTFPFAPAVMQSSRAQLDLTHNQRITVTRSDSHPTDYLYVEVDCRRFFLGVLRPGMTRGDVRRMALAWLAERETSPTSQRAGRR